MERHAYQDIPGLPSPSTKDHTPYIKQVTAACSIIKSTKHIDRPIIHPVADFIIYTAFLLMDDKEWLFTFKESQRKSLNFFRDQDTHWKTIALGLSTPEVERVVMERLPNLDRKKYFPISNPEPAPGKIPPEGIPTQKKSTVTSPRVRRGLKWKQNKRWDDLSPSDRKIFFEGCRRAQKPKREGGFWWAELGVESLSKKLRVPHRQVKRSRFHLCELGLWARIKRGYKDQGASKYHIFLTPKMADRFFLIYRHRGKRQGRENPIARLRQDERSAPAPYQTMGRFTPR